MNVLLLRPDQPTDCDVAGARVYRDVSVRRDDLDGVRQHVLHGDERGVFRGGRPGDDLQREAPEAIGREGRLSRVSHSSRCRLPTIPAIATAPWVELGGIESGGGGLTNRNTRDGVQ